ncbi:HAMP domain-containing protein, partial [Candidatus Aerophobetes bacterium]|nr:HAMP domain-containing protein [Candidatus Aerophobetes bacterium]
VVNNWYISAYEPIYDPDHGIIGMLYVGVLEDKYIDIRNRILLSFLPIIFGGIATVLVLSYLLSRGLSEPIKRLVKATRRIARGETDYVLEKEKKYPKIQELSYLEIQELTRNFNQMAAALYRRETELKKANDDLRQINRNYMEILGFVTHEIKNRLAVILGSTYVLEKGMVGELSKSQKKMVDILLRNAERLSEMIKNYLDLSRIEKGELKVNKQEVDFKRDILESVLDEFKGRFEARRITLKLEIPDSFKIMADPDLLKIVMENLLSNAIKYGKEKGMVKIGARMEKKECRINVWNEGEGIPKDRIDQLFAKFTRLSGEKFRKEQGSGLGLFITKEIIQKHGGKIWAESEEGKWADFIFTLPSD